MKKLFMIGLVALVGLGLVLAIGARSLAHAQTQAAPTPNATTPDDDTVACNGQGMGRGGMMGGRQGRGGMMGGRQGRGMMNDGEGCPLQDGQKPGFMHDAMNAALAEGLGLTSDQLTQRLQNGETLVDIGIEKNLSLKDYRDLMVTARDKALAQAVTDGTITQEQADAMKTRMQDKGLGGFGMGPGGCPGLDTQQP